MVTLGEQLRLLDDEDTPQRQLLVQQARQEHAAFWKKWYPFRCSEEGDAQGHAFWHVLDLINRNIDPDGMRGMFAKFCQLNPGTLVVDLAAGPRLTMLEVLLHNFPSLAGYVVMEPSSRSAPVSRNPQWNGLMEFIPWDFWEPMPTPSILEIANKRKATGIVMLTYWGATYLPAREIRAWVSSALSISNAVYINMLTLGRFQPEVLRRYYAPHLLKLLLMGRVSPSAAVRGLMAIKTMVSFGREFAELMPLWTSDSFRLALYGTCQVNRIQGEILWDQTMFMELLPLHS
jgi:hypothetical protein